MVSLGWVEWGEASLGRRGLLGWVRVRCGFGRFGRVSFVLDRLGTDWQAGQGWAFPGEAWKGGVRQARSGRVACGG